MPHRTPLTALRCLELHGAYYEHDDALLAVLNYWPPQEVAAPALTRLVMCHLRAPCLDDQAPGLPWLPRLPMLQASRAVLPCRHDSCRRIYCAACLPR